MLAKHQWRGNTLGCGCGWNWPEELTYFCGEEERIAKAHIEHQVEALQAAGCLPKLPSQCIIPTGWGDECLGAWPTTSHVDPVSAWPKGQVATPDDQWMSPADARSLAAALLAAADAAEVNR